MSIFGVTVDFPPTPRMPRATRRVPRSVLEVWGGGSATARVNAALLASEVVTAMVEHATAEHPLVLELTRSKDGSDHRWPAAPRYPGWWATATTGTRGGPAMRLVEALADRWAVENRPQGGTRAWLELDNHTDHNLDRNRDADRVAAS